MAQYKEPLIDKIRAMAKRLLKPSVVGRFIYPVLQRVWRAYVIPMRIRRLHRKGYAVLKELHGILTANNIPYYCDCGTLIGFLRDGGFIAHDDDIDIGIMPEKVSPQRVANAFLDEGWGFVQGFTYEGRVIEFTLKHPCGVTVDVFLHKYCEDDKRFLHEIFLRWYPDRKYPNERANTALKYRLRGPDGLTTMKVHGVEVSIPTNAREVLDSEYGPWEHPDPSFKSEMIPHEELAGFAMRIDEDELLAAEAANV